MSVSSCKEYFDTLDGRFVAEAGAGVSAVFQFELTGENGGDWHVVVEEGAMAVHEGKHEEATVTLSAKADDYVQIANGSMNGLRAVMTRKMRIAGNMMMARKMQTMFPTG